MNYTLNNFSRRFQLKRRLQKTKTYDQERKTRKRRPLYLIVTKAIFSYLRDFQDPFVLCEILSNRRHYVSFGHETRLIEELSKYQSNRTGKEVCSSCLLLYLCTETCTTKRVVLLSLGHLCLIYLHTRPACSSLGHFNKCILYGKGLF